jgi:hypothetical protein
MPEHLEGTKNLLCSQEGIQTPRGYLIVPEHLEGTQGLLYGAKVSRKHLRDLRREGTQLSHMPFGATHGYHIIHT